MIQCNSQQPSSIGYCPSIYHPMISNSYYGALTPAPSPTPFGAGVGQMAPHIQVSSQIEHDMHTRSQFYNDAPTSQNAVPYYLSASSSSRDTASNGIQKEASHQGHFWIYKLFKFMLIYAKICTLYNLMQIMQQMILYLCSNWNNWICVFKWICCKLLHITPSAEEHILW